MTQAEQKRADDRMRAEIARLLTAPGQIGLNSVLAPFLAAAAVMAGTAALVMTFIG